MQVVNVKVSHIRPMYNNLKEWIENDDNYYIGRRGIVFVDGSRYPPNDSLFANPYKEGKDGTRAQIILKYEKYIKLKIKNEEVNLDDLRGKTLGCWCTPLPCHGDVLLRLLR